MQPSIEREYPYIDWAEAEHKILREFQSKARLHMDPAQLPPTSAKFKLSWLAITQHYGVPTRLLDFTYSPYVALYFALRNRKDKSPYAEVWGMDAVALRAQSEKTCRAAEELVRKRLGTDIALPKRVSLIDFESALQRAQREDEFWESSIRKALSPDSTRLAHFDRNGYVALALPPVQNARLSSQQGVFLFNAAEGLSFEESLGRMMQGVGDGWYKRFRVPTKALHEIEEQLFQLNVHDLSLFPDVEGLAGFVRQKTRLHW